MKIEFSPYIIFWEVEEDSGKLRKLQIKLLSDK